CPLVNLTHAPVPREPTKRALHHPPFRLNTEAPNTWRTFHDLHIPVSLRLAPLSQLVPPVGGVGPDLGEARHEAREAAKELARSPRIVRIGRRHVPGDGQTQGIDQEVPFPPLHARMRVIATHASRFLHRLDTLAIHDGGARVGMATDALPL